MQICMYSRDDVLALITFIQQIKLKTHESRVQHKLIYIVDVVCVICINHLSMLMSRQL
jgi:hypothetical protein